MNLKPQSLVKYAGLVGLALLQFNAGAIIVGPYTPDAGTLHLWHLDESATPAVDSALTGGTNCVGLLNGATLGNPSFSGFGNALNTIDGGQSGTAATNKDALLTPSTANPPGNIQFTYAGSSGAFTFEAVVWIGFDPTLNLGPTANGGNNRGTSCEILTCESGTAANRIFQFRIFPKGNTLLNGGTGTVIATNGPFVTFENIRAGSAGQPTIYAPIPMTGPDAIQSNSWYHVAVTYNGVPNTANNIKFYWTLLDPTRAAANQIPITSVQATCSGPNPISSSAAAPVIGNEARNRASNFLGLVDEVRVSNFERGPGQMMFTAAVVGIVSEPASQFVAAGDNVLLSVGATGQAVQYQWQFYGTNLPGATSSTLTLSNITFSQAGPYQVTVFNGAPSSTNSTVATITVGNLFSELFNGGVNDSRALLSGGDVDPHWQMVHSDDPNYPGPAAIVVGSPPATYLANGPSSMWLAPVASGNALNGIFNYRTTFILDVTDPTTAILNGGWAMDNNGLDILLNGVSVGLTASGFAGLTGFSITNGYVHPGLDTNGNPITITNTFVSGLNTLECVISNAPATGGPNPTGLRIEARGIALPLPPTAPYFTALPSDVVTQVLQRATFSAVIVGSGPLMYQWYHGSTLLAGQTQRTLVLPAVGSGDGGTYILWVTNSVGVTNASATLTVITPPALAWVGNDPTNPTFWDTNTINWLDTGSSTAAAFAPEDDVLFDSRGSGQPTVDLVEPLNPNSITVNASTDYVLMSSGGLGSIFGSVPLIKTNTGTLVIDVTNNSTAPVTILGGTVQIGTNDANGSFGSGSVSNDGAITFARSDTFPVPNTLSGTGSVTMAGQGTAVVSGHNLYSGPTLISAGTLSANSSGALGATNSGTTVANGGQLFIFGDVTLDPEPLVLSGSGPGSGALRKGSGAATTFGGPVTLGADAMINLDNNATLSLTNPAGITASGFNLDLSGGNASQGSVPGPITLGSGGVTKDGAGTWTLTATNNHWTGGITVNTGTLQIGTGGTNCSFGTGAILVNGGTLNINSAVSYLITNDITIGGGTANFTSGTGTLGFSGAIANYSTNTYTCVAALTLPATMHNDGTMIFNVSNSPAISPAIDGVGNVSLFGATVFRATTNDALGSGTCTIGNGQASVSRLELTGGIALSNQIAIFPRAFYGVVPASSLNVAPDIVNVSGTNIVAPPSSITIGGGGDLLTLEADSGKLTYAGGVTSTAAGRRLALRGSGTGEVLGNLDFTAANSLFVYKLDAGTWTLWGANTPGQSTTISNGVLVINGTMDTNLINVAGGSLAGTGVLSGPVVVNAGATLAPGPGIATLTISNTLTLASGSFTSVELNKTAGTSDEVIGISTLTYGGTLLVTNIGGTLANGDSFKLFDATNYMGGFSNIVPQTPGPAPLRWDKSQLLVNGRLGVVAVPPPVITHVGYDGVNFTLSGTNGTAGQTFYVLSSTNVTTPLSNWVPVATNVFAGNAFSVAIPVTAEPKRFYLLSIP